MQNSLISAAIAGLVGAIAAIAVAASGLVAPDAARVAGKKMVSATIYIDQLGGDCVITTTPQTLEAFKRETIEWSIVNRCETTLNADVEVVFDSSKDPLDASCVRKGKKKIKCSLKNGVTPDFYKYSVKADGAITEDPDLEIVQ